MTVQPATRLQGVKTVAELTERTKYATTVRRTQAGNSANALWGGAALAKYGGVVQGEWDEPLDTVLADLLGDLLHLADALDLDFEDALHKAEMNYTAEVDGE